MDQSPMEVSVAGYFLAPERAIRRKPSRPEHLIDSEFNRKFEYDTLIYDAVFDESTNVVRLVCPPLTNLLRPFSKSVCTVEPTGKRVLFKINELDRTTRIDLKIPSGSTKLVITGELGQFRVDLRPVDKSTFSGRRVVYTLQKNNNLEWIVEWAEFYHTVHGADAFLIYDNGSDYERDDIQKAIVKAIPAAIVKIVSWPFKFGPGGVGKWKYWDSDFCQHGALEHARWAFLSNARSVVHCDIDELVVSSTGRTVFEEVEKSKLGVIMYFGDWIVGVSNVTKAPIADGVYHFRDFRYRLRRIKSKWSILTNRFPNRCRPKWSCVPHKCPDHAQWKIHRISGWGTLARPTKHINFKHFREINTSWKYNRQKLENIDSGNVEKDFELIKAFEKIGWA